MFINFITFRTLFRKSLLNIWQSLEVIDLGIKIYNLNIFMAVQDKTVKSFLKSDKNLPSYYILKNVFDLTSDE